MKITVGHWIMPFVAMLAGGGLVYAGAKLGWGLVWVMGGGFFITVGIVALLLSLAWVLPGPLGDFLRSPAVNILLLLAVLGMLIATVVVGIVAR